MVTYAASYGTVRYGMVWCGTSLVWHGARVGLLSPLLKRSNFYVYRHNHSIRTSAALPLASLYIASSGSGGDRRLKNALSSENPSAVTEETCITGTKPCQDALDALTKKNARQPNKQETEDKGGGGWAGRGEVIRFSSRTRPQSYGPEKKSHLGQSSDVSSTDHLQTDHDLDHLVPHLLLWEVVEDLHSANTPRQAGAIYLDRIYFT